MEVDTGVMEKTTLSKNMTAGTTNWSLREHRLALEQAENRQREASMAELYANVSKPLNVPEPEETWEPDDSLPTFVYRPHKTLICSTVKDEFQKASAHIQKL